jgi:hypothetical protein
MAIACLLTRLAKDVVIATALNPDDGLEDRRVEHLKLQTIPPSLLNKNR